MLFLSAGCVTSSESIQDTKLWHNASFLLHHAHQHSTHQHICVFKVVSPVGPDLPLASDVPHVQLKTLRLDTLNVESLKQTHNKTVAVKR